MFFKALRHSKQTLSKTPPSSSPFKSRARTGLLKSKIPTPNFLFPINSGCLPGLTPSTCPDTSHTLLQLVLADLAHLAKVIPRYRQYCEENKEEVGNVLKKYLNIPQEQLTIMTTGIAGEEKCIGHPKNMTMEFKQKDTSIKMGEKEYIEAIKEFKPDIFTTPTHSIVASTSKKKKERAVKASREYISENLVSELTSESDMLMTISIEESYKLISPIIYEKISTFNDSISGYFFTVHSLTNETRNSIFTQFFEKYPENQKPLFLESDGNPISVLQSIFFHGIDMFEARFPLTMAEENKCLNFQVKMPEDFKESTLNEEMLNSTEKKVKFFCPLNEEFKKDSGPLTENCECPSCTSINRAYVHHLLDCKEMNATILLTVHNMHVYEKFFEEIRKHIENDTLAEYISWFLSTQCE